MKLKLTVIPILLLLACTNRNTPQAVAEDFIYNYYKLANQNAALLLCSGLATEKLANEINLIQEVRAPGDSVEEMPNIQFILIGKETSDELDGITHELFNYQLTIKKRDGTTTHTQKVVITTENIDGKWKVVNFDEY